MMIESHNHASVERALRPVRLQVVGSGCPQELVSDISHIRRPREGLMISEKQPWKIEPCENRALGRGRSRECISRKFKRMKQ